MELPIFQSHPTCSGCSLSQKQPPLKSIGMATRVWDGGFKARSKAVLLLGANPGVQEDETGLPFVGRIGEITNKGYIEASGISEWADIYLNNAVRCTPQSNQTISQGMVKACRTHIVEDLRELRSKYDEVVIVCCGAEAIGSILGEKLALARFDQGRVVELDPGMPTVVFATYNAGALLPGRDPSKRSAVRSHLNLVREYLQHGKIPMKLNHLEGPFVGPNVLDPPTDIALLSLDIETYGCLRNYPDQTVFHPFKSVRFDGCPTDQLLVTTGLSWRNPEDGRLCVKIYRHHVPDDVARLRDILERTRCPLLGQNIQFDLMYLRAGGFRDVLPIGRRTVYDLTVVNFLEDDQRPERSLKPLSLLLQVASYQDQPIQLSKGEKFDGPDDPRLYYYNALDCCATLVGYEILSDRITERYGEDTPKWKAPCRDWYSDLIWFCIDMSENGIEYDRDRLELTHKLKLSQMDRLATRLRDQFGLVVAGTGSKKSQLGLLNECITRLLKTHSHVVPCTVFRGGEEHPVMAEVLTLEGEEIARRIQTTAKTAEYSTNQDNIELLLGKLSRGTPDRSWLKLWQRYKRAAKITQSYSGPLLGSHAKGEPDHSNELIGTRAHPQWYPVPSYFTDADSGFGGTQQGRITSRGPALQTQPPVIERCQRSRFRGGAILHCDMSQIELRVAAMMSGDTEMLADYRAVPPGNRHAKTGSICAGFEINKHDHPKWYHAGKTLNFLTLFLGAADTFRETLLRESSLDLPLVRCRQIISAFDIRHKGLRSWQRSLIFQAKRNGCIVLPVQGISRTFLGDIDATYVSTIANFPVQTTAALLTLSAQMACWKEIRARGLRTLCVSNTYDEGLFDCPADEVEIVTEICLRNFRWPPLLPILLAGGYHELPIDAEVKVEYNTPV